MSELLSAAAEVLGVPEPLVSRSAAARAAEAGVPAEDILSAWAGGASAPAAPPAETEAAAEPEAEVPSAGPDAAAEPEAEAPSAKDEPALAPVTPSVPAAPAAPAPTAPAAPARPPVLVGGEDNPMTVFAGVLGLFLALVLVGLLGPSMPIDPPGERTGIIAFSPAAEAGRSVYLSEGCASCHTQMVRPVIADVGLGPVTLNDTNQVVGIRRFGPDLADVGSRLDANQIAAIVTGFDGHPTSGLRGEDLSALIAYLSESTSGR